MGAPRIYQSANLPICHFSANHTTATVANDLPIRPCEANLPLPDQISLKYSYDQLNKTYFQVCHTYQPCREQKCKSIHPLEKGAARSLSLPRFHRFLRYWVGCDADKLWWRGETMVEMTDRVVRWWWIQLMMQTNSEMLESSRVESYCCVGSSGARWGWVH